MVQDQIFFVGQKAFIEKDGEVLVLTTRHGHLDFPGGKIQVGEEKLAESFIREVKEETGLEVEFGEPFYTWYFTFGSHHEKVGQKVFLVGYKCKYLGGEVTLSKAHVSYRWVNKDNYREVNDNSGHFKALQEYFK